MNSEELLAAIKSRGYWRIEIHSTEYRENVLSGRASMERLMDNATVSLRGGPYPYHSANEIAYNGKWLEGQVDWSYNREYWRLYKSGQWLHYVALSGAWITREELFQNMSPFPPKHSGYLHIRWDVLFRLTTILRFAVGLAQGGILDPTAFLSVQLHNTRDYMLYESFERPFFLHQEFVNQSDRTIEQQKSVSIGQLSAIADQIALDMAIEVFSVFNWVPSEAAVRMLAEDQKKLVERKLQS